jgi:hypothetical protein
MATGQAQADDKAFEVRAAYDDANFGIRATLARA